MIEEKPLLVFAIMNRQTIEYHDKTQTRGATMRQKRTVRPSLFDSVLEHDIAIELEAMSNLLDAHPIVLGWVESDLRDRVVASAPANSKIRAWIESAETLEALGAAVMDQTQRRVFQGETVPADKKVFSLFEPHTDIIIKGARDVAFGHKLNLTTGRSGLVLDVVIEPGNPADTARFLTMIERQTMIYGRPPRQVATDGGYASQENLAAAKALGTKDVAFHKKKGLKVSEMVKSPWVYRKLRNFRAGIEGNISCLKRAYGLSRCTWKGLEHFRSYVWSAVVSRNVLLLARLLQT